MTRSNILTNDVARQQFIEGCIALKAWNIGNGFSLYDVFPWWHAQAMTPCWVPRAEHFPIQE